MRYTTVTITPPDDLDWSDDRRQVRVDGDDWRKMLVNDQLVVTREALHYINLLNDGTAVGIGQFRGNAEQLATIESEAPEILSSTATAGEKWLAYVHYEPEDLEKALLEIVDTQKVSIDWPAIYTEHGIRFTLFGEDMVLNQMSAALPDDLDVALERTGDYQPSMRDPTWKLTERQEEIVRTAMTAGYYDIPRRATQRDLAAELGLSRGTIGEHLRRAEGKIIQSVIGDP